MQNIKRLFSEGRQFELVAKLGLIIGAIGVYLFFASISGCQTVKKIIHKEKISIDSTAVTSHDSTSVKHEETKESKFSIDSLHIEVQYDTGWLDQLDQPNITPQDYYTYEGKVLGDVIKAAKNGGKPTKIIIRTGKINKDENVRRISDSSSAQSASNVQVHEKKNIVAKDIKKTYSWINLLWWLLLLIPIYLIYKNRNRIWKFILTIIPI